MVRNRATDRVALVDHRRSARRLNPSDGVNRNDVVAAPDADSRRSMLCNLLRVSPPPQRAHSSRGCVGTARTAVLVTAESRAADCESRCDTCFVLVIDRFALQGWEGQLARIERWHERANAALSAGSPDAEDFLLAFFQSSYHLRAWLLNSGAATKAELDHVLRNTPALRLCRDIANGSKHHTLKPTERTERVGLMREYAPRLAAGWRWRLLAIQRRNGAGPDLYELDELMDACVNAWRAFCIGRRSTGLAGTAVR